MWADENRSINTSYCCMKQREKCSGRGFDSRLVHQKKIDTVYNVHHCVSKWSERMSLNSVFF